MLTVLEIVLSVAAMASALVGYFYYESHRLDKLDAAEQKAESVKKAATR